jgi:acetate kinase
MAVRILVLNGGSSSFKCALYEFSEGAAPARVSPPLWKERLEWNGSALGSALDVTLEPVLKRAGPVDAAGHRIVHGGRTYRTSTWLTTEVRAAISAQAEVAPAHNRFELEAIDAVTSILGSKVPQVAVFDTAFHATLAPPAYVYPGPNEWLASEGIRRYGFHGISCQYASRRAADMLGKMPPRLLVCHLGNGASLCAIRDGRSIDTTMGFTPLEGLMMGTRCGSIDPGIIVYLLRHRGYTAEQLDHILNRESGLLGVSGVSGDMRAILEAMARGNARARLAFDVYVHRLAREAGAMIAVLGGLDALVFTGGVGENSPLVREALCGQLTFLGLLVDPAKNAQPNLDQDIATGSSSAPILVIRAEEEWEIAQECRRLASRV